MIQFLIRILSVFFTISCIGSFLVWIQRKFSRYTPPRSPIIMTHDQIRHIAEEQAHLYASMCSVDNDGYEAVRLAYLAGARSIFDYIAERYCVVERSKVVEYHNQGYMEICVDDEVLRANALGKLQALEDIFGSETFNKKEDEKM